MKAGFESLGRVRLQGILLLALAFGAGIAAGMAVERVRAARAVPPAWRGPDARGPGMRQLAVFDELGLTEEQRTRIRAIIEASRPIVDSVLRSSMPAVQAVHDSVRAEIRAVLTPEQQRRFDELEPQWEPRGGPGGRGPRRGAPPPLP